MLNATSDVVVVSTVSLPRISVTANVVVMTWLTAAHNDDIGARMRVGLRNPSDNDEVGGLTPADRVERVLRAPLPSSDAVDE
ncbi:hypothetical protein ATK74_2811 [Propionicimonas paludicola]|uniref:Uncharacterized protein n=1 Tax=Propionicimonas paludicola TaxID=185243 RepID=A0A2A9CUW6_9ACTN|nr:hypothetical protein [Propionicimonas paludicola]PFG18227.1 hypothetical protein ATK74_2811 [Propionicimonas paludicola]